VKKGGYTENSFRHAPEGHILERLFLEFVQPREEESVLSLSKALNVVVQAGSKKALYYQVNEVRLIPFHLPTSIILQLQQVESVREYRQFDCFLTTPWVSTTPALSAMALRKNSPLTPFMRRAVLELIEDGTLTAAENRWRKKATTSCFDEYEGIALGFERLLAVFFVLAAGGAGGCAVLAVEVVLRRKQKAISQSANPLYRPREKVGDHVTIAIGKTERKLDKSGLHS